MILTTEGVLAYKAWLAEPHTHCVSPTRHSIHVPNFPPPNIPIIFYSAPVQRQGRKHGHQLRDCLVQIYLPW